MEIDSQRICIIGTGYVGLVTATCFAELGNHVIAVDKDRSKIEKLRDGVCSIYEPGLEELLQDNLKVKRLIFTDDVSYGIKGSQIIFICVGTPPLSDGGTDLSQVEGVSRVIAESINGYKLVVEKSTVPVKTAQWIKRTISLYNGNSQKIDVASNPEFLKEGSAVEDFMHPDRVVIGVESEKAKEMLLDLYKPFNCPILVTDLSTAEIIKHASNSFLAMKISFINMIADLCERTGADIKMVARGMGLDRRIGEEFLDAGIGYGGSCFPKDVKAFTRIAEELKVNFNLLKEVDDINKRRIDSFISRVKEALWVLSGKTVAVLGLSFKPNTDDIREAPSMGIVGRLLEEGARLNLYDPKATDNMKEVFPPCEGRLSYFNSPSWACSGVEAVLILTEWNEFYELDLRKLKKLMKTPIIIDGRNVFNPDDMEGLGFEYYPVGRKSVRNYY